MRGSVVTVAGGALAIVLCFSAAPLARQVESQRPAQRVLAPIPLEEGTSDDAVSAAQPSPDGTVLAYGLYEPSRRQRTTGSYYLPSGVASAFSHDRIRLVDVATGRALSMGDEQPEWSSWAPSWSPDGQALAFVSSRDGHPRIWRWERQSGRVTRVSDAIVVVPTVRVTMESWRLLQWTPDGRTILVRLLPEGMSLAAFVEYSNLAHEHVPGAAGSDKEPTATVYPRADRRGSDRPGDEGSVYMDRYNHFLGDLAAVTVASGQVRRLVSRVHVERYELSPDGRHLAYYDIEALRIVSLENGREVAADPVKAQQLPRVDLQWAPASDAVLHLVDGSLRRVDVAGGAATSACDVPLKTLPVWSAVHRAWFVNDGRRLLRLGPGNSPTVVATLRESELVSWLFEDFRQGALYGKPGVAKVWVWTRTAEDQPLRLEEVSVDSGEVRPVGAPAPSSHERARLAALLRGRPAVYRHEDAAHAPNFWVASPDASAPRQLSHAGDVYERYVLGEPRLLEWITDDGERRRGAMLLPAGYKEGTRVPMIVSAYAGRRAALRQVEAPGLEGRNGNFQLLATRGYAVLIPDSDLKVGTPMLDIAKNMLPAVSKAVELGIADERRLGVMGHSFGGYSTLSLIVQTRRFRAAVAFAGISSWLTYWGSMWENGESQSFPLLEAPGAYSRIERSPWEARARYIENSPFFYLDRVETPLLLIHGEIDPLPALQSDQVYFALRRLGKPVEYARYRDTGHSMTDPANQLDYWRRVIEWFDRHLKSDTPPSYGEPRPNAVR
jgi:dipeptidyl aminopeptidase/acylaminoacyl peptidase